MKDLSRPDSVLDPEAIDKLRALQRPGRPNLLLRIIAMFRDDAPRQVERMTMAASSGDDETLLRSAHTLKSTAANIGAWPLRDACRSIEHKVQQGDLAGARDEVGAVPAILSEVLDALDREEAAA